MINSEKEYQELLKMHAREEKKHLKRVRRNINRIIFIGKVKIFIFKLKGVI